MKNQNETKWVDGRMVQGAYFQWLNREHPEADSIINLIRIIADNTLAYRKKYAYIKSDKFRLGHNTIWKHTKKAIEFGLLESIKTRGYTKYELILPEEIETKTLWLGSVTKATQQTKGALTKDKIEEIRRKAGW